LANIGASLRSLPLGYIISAPMTAAIKAQALAAQTTVDFIKEVGLKPTETSGLEADGQPLKGDVTSGESGKEALEARYVEFKFDRVLEETKTTTGSDGTPTNTTTYKVVPSKLTVPLLAIVPIPYIRISDMTIDFEFEIKDVESKESTTDKNISTSASGSYWFVKGEVKGSYTNRTTNKRETDRRATLKITVNAVQDSIPEGLGKVLDMLNEAMKVVPLSAGSEITVPA
jgi:hypothetical protein